MAEVNEVIAANVRICPTFEINRPQICTPAIKPMKYAEAIRPIVRSEYCSSTARTPISVLSNPCPKQSNEKLKKSEEIE